jgi:hypothetical protein
MAGLLDLGGSEWVATQETTLAGVGDAFVTFV